jgi:hypothetical protein
MVHDYRTATIINVEIYEKLQYSSQIIENLYGTKAFS